MKKILSNGITAEGKPLLGNGDWISYKAHDSKGAWLGNGEMIRRLWDELADMTTREMDFHKAMMEANRKCADGFEAMRDVIRKSIPELVEVELIVKERDSFGPVTVLARVTWEDGESMEELI